eukprot:COSAG05_NODE_6790_length_903_cov_0.832090_2_plen_98_part_00
MRPEPGALILNPPLPNEALSPNTTGRRIQMFAQRWHRWVEASDENDDESELPTLPNESVLLEESHVLSSAVLQVQWAIQARSRRGHMANPRYRAPRR